MCTFCFYFLTSDEYIVTINATHQVRIIPVVSSPYIENSKKDILRDRCSHFFGYIP